MHGITLKGTTYVKHIGIIFDEHLTFQKHIKFFNARLKRTVLLAPYLWMSNTVPKICYRAKYYSSDVRLISVAHYKKECITLFKNVKSLSDKHILKLKNTIFTHNAINDQNPII